MLQANLQKFFDPSSCSVLAGWLTTKFVFAFNTAVITHFDLQPQFKYMNHFMCTSYHKLTRQFGLRPVMADDVFCFQMRSGSAAFFILFDVANDRLKSPPKTIKSHSKDNIFFTGPSKTNWVVPIWYVDIHMCQYLFFSFYINNNKSSLWVCVVFQDVKLTITNNNNKVLAILVAKFFPQWLFAFHFPEMLLITLS